MKRQRKEERRAGEELRKIVEGVLNLIILLFLVRAAPSLFSSTNCLHVESGLNPEDFLSVR